MKKWTIRILVLLFLLTGSACSQSVPPAEGEETLLVQGESGGPENLPPAFDPVVPAAEAVDPQWFADAAFVGDSVSVMLENYNTSTGRLGSPAFFCSVSLSQTNALSYQAGNASAGAKKVYLMLGMNCIAGGVDRASQDLVTLVDQILAKSPEAAIFIQSVTPMTADSPRADDALNNGTIQAFNERMRQICQEKQWYFVNVAEAVSDENGFLRSEFSGDRAMGIHFNYDGAAAWADYLLTHVPQALK